ncbi:MAG: outer-membrane lipoprotein carrier protein LolA [Rhodomicrobium sp.]
MHQGRKTSKFPRTARRLAHCAVGVLLSAGCVDFALAEGGQTEVMKTMPPNPPPAASAPVAPAKPASPIGGSGAPWQTDLSQQKPQEPRPAPAAQIADSDYEVVQKINAYFNVMTNLSGTFVQTDPDSKQKHGKFYLARPGKVRFDYGAPSQLKIISDGEYLAIEDHDLDTTDRYPIDVTPFRLLLSETVDLARDANILSIEQGPADIVVALEDRKGSSGRIRLFFNKADMSLKEWIITDAQGLDTRIQVANLEQNKQLAAGLFEFSKTIGLNNNN